MKLIIKLTSLALTIFLLFAGGCGLIYHVSQEDEIRDGKEKAEMIVRALEEYKIDHGSYPEKLEYLVPQYITQAPTTLTGNSILYYPIGDYYEVYFRLAKREKLESSCSYIRRLEVWDCSYSVE